MSACMFIASDYPLPEAAPSREYPLEINIDTGTVFDGGADDNYFLNSFIDVGDYCDKQYGASLEWEYTDGRAERIIEYIKDALRYTDCVELWRVWLGTWFDYEDSPVVHRSTVISDELSADHIKAVNDAVIWNKPDKNNPNRPSHYCLRIIKQEATL